VSYVLFTHRPVSEEDKKIYLDVCNQWMADFETYEDISSNAPKNSNFIPFYWPTTLTDTSKGSCKDGLYGYDYARAAVLLGLIGGEASTDGPILALRKGLSWYVLDVSKFEPIDVERAFYIWKKQICLSNPTEVQFSLVKFREYFRTLVQTYGEAIVKAVGSDS
jgi:hypothetical protein